VETHTWLAVCVRRVPFVCPKRRRRRNEDGESSPCHLLSPRSAPHPFRGDSSCLLLQYLLFSLPSTVVRPRFLVGSKVGVPTDFICIGMKETFVNERMHCVDLVERLSTFAFLPSLLSEKRLIHSGFWCRLCGSQVGSSIR